MNEPDVVQHLVVGESLGLDAGWIPGGMNVEIEQLGDFVNMFFYPRYRFKVQRIRRYLRIA